jgi:alpha-N-arabinofuranosidase
VLDKLIMATFTRLADDERPTISVDPSAVLSKIEDNIYGGFTEYVSPNLSMSAR